MAYNPNRFSGRSVMTAVTGYSLSNLEMERTELRKDLIAFMSAYDLIRKRLLESAEEHPSRAAGLERWSGTWACIGSLELAAKSIERQILEIDELIRRVISGEAPDLDVPHLSVVKVKEEKIP